eukprot:8439573-Ditylum_brightwellii.AAC.1
MQLLAKEDYWKEGRVSAIICPNFKAWMTHMRFKFIKKYLRLSDYSISVADKAQDMLWKARDSIVTARNHCKQFMSRCCGEIKSKPIKKDWTLWCSVNFKTGFCFDFRFDDDILCATNCQHLPWGMTGEMAMRVVREHWCPGTTTDTILFSNI